LSFFWRRGHRRCNLSTRSMRGGGLASTKRAGTRVARFREARECLSAPCLLRRQVCHLVNFSTRVFVHYAMYDKLRAVFSLCSGLRSFRQNFLSGQKIIEMIIVVIEVILDLLHPVLLYRYRYFCVVFTSRAGPAIHIPVPQVRSEQLFSSRSADR
jgi:hypothetical protein